MLFSDFIKANAALLVMNTVTEERKIERAEAKLAEMKARLADAIQAQDEMVDQADNARAVLKGEAPDHTHQIANLDGGSFPLNSYAAMVVRAVDKGSRLTGNVNIFKRAA